MPTQSRGHGTRKQLLCPRTRVGPSRCKSYHSTSAGRDPCRGAAAPRSPPSSRNRSTGRVALRRHNLAGDVQADLTVHGGPDKAVYAYPSEHYPWWTGQLPDMELTWGAFGENLSTLGLVEDIVRIGDEYRIGTARLIVTQPRLPCFKLGIRFGDQGIIKRFRNSGRPGIYFAVAEEGDITAGDPIELIRTDESAPTVVDVFRLILDDKENVDGLRRALRRRPSPRSCARTSPSGSSTLGRTSSSAAPDPHIG